MAAHWPHKPAGHAIADSLNATPEYVATRTLHQWDLEWANCRVIDGDVVETVERLQAEGDGLVTVLGNGVLVQTLIANGLVDIYRVMLHPLFLELASGCSESIHTRCGCGSPDAPQPPPANEVAPRRRLDQPSHRGPLSN